MEANIFALKGLISPRFYRGNQIAPTQGEQFVTEGIQNYVEARASTLFSINHYRTISSGIKNSNFC